ncbi:MAG: hypothetical protein M1479_07920 [Actinobacteria bacterium]|nr:hypothetical protein [Actinomycetota bacterium]
MVKIRSIYYDPLHIKEFKDFWSGKYKEKVLLSPIYYKQWDLIHNFFKLNRIKYGRSSNTVHSRKPICDDLDFLNEYYIIQQTCLSQTGRSCEVGAYPTGFLGEYLVSAVFGAEIFFVGTNTHSWSAIKDYPLKNYKILNSFKQLYNKSKWISKVLKILDYFVKKKVPYILIPNSFIDAMNFAFLLRGPERACLDVYDYQEELYELLELGNEFNIYFLNKQLEIIGEHNRNILGNEEFYRNCMCYIPQSCVDTYSLMSPDVYKEFGFVYHQKIINKYGSVFFHIHSNGLHVLKEVIKLSKISEIFFTEDTGFDRPFIIRHKLRELSEDVPITFICTKKEFLDALNNKTLCMNSRYVVPFCDFMGMDWDRSKNKSEYFSDLEEAIAAMEMARNYKSK